MKIKKMKREDFGGFSAPSCFSHGSINFTFSMQYYRKVYDFMIENKIQKVETDEGIFNIGFIEEMTGNIDYKKFN